MTAPARHRNWPLLAGATLVAALLLLALAGPALAPKDPLGRTLIAEIGGRVRGVPFPPFQSWEFPLGSDRFGRDLLSRLLWAVRPTLILVTIVAAVRLLLGVLIGMVAGWSGQGLGRALGLLIDAALAIPVLIVALAAITAVGIERGLIAFIFGMALTGWAETAQTVRAQTQLLATQPYIQAARALGATGPQIMVRHIWRHIAPLLAMLLAFEISAALLLAGALGFLGYFIGGGVWVILSGELIPNAERITGLPELGQLIGTAEMRVSSRPPWEMIFPGAVIVVAILGFTLLGEGLRRHARQAAPRPSRLGLLFGVFEEALVTRAGRLDGRAARPIAAVAAVALVALGGLGWWRTQGAAAALAPAPAAAPAAAAPTAWPGERGDPAGTLRAAAMPAAPTLSWEFNHPGGLAGGPAIAPDGTLYLTGADGVLLAVSPAGAELWRAPIDAEPIGAPALGPDGTLYVADRGAGLSAFGPAGEARWRFQSAYRPEATSGPVVGPDGTIYYTVVDGVQAVTPAGAGKWVGSDRDLPYENLLPRLSPDGALVFLKDVAFSTVDGSRQPITIVPDEARFVDSAFIVGADGRTYYRSSHSLFPWRRVEAGVAVQAPIGWAAANVLFPPADAGVTAAGAAWLLYSTEFADTRLIWLDGAGQQLGEAAAQLRGARALAVADDGAVQLCGTARNRTLRCLAFRPGPGAEPLWSLDLGAPGVQIRGGASVGGRLYIAADDGNLYAIE
jgi:ABC-type dipeptide/oligopeptide/nickel transport system permease subunit/outer membrane protein assembly factor BamB